MRHLFFRRLIFLLNKGSRFIHFGRYEFFYTHNFVCLFICSYPACRLSVIQRCLIFSGGIDCCIMIQFLRSFGGIKRFNFIRINGHCGRVLRHRMSLDIILLHLTTLLNCICLVLMMGFDLELLFSLKFGHCLHWTFLIIRYLKLTTFESIILGWLLGWLFGNIWWMNHRIRPAPTTLFIRHIRW